MALEFLSTLTRKYAADASRASILSGQGNIATLLFLGRASLIISIITIISII